MSDPAAVCSECGARIEPGAAQCDLCGAPQGSDKPRAMPPRRATDIDPIVPTQKPGVFCHACGWKNPPGARFCSQCGTALQDVKPEGSDAFAPPPRTAATPGRAPSSAPVGRTLGIVIGVAVLLVVALFVITALSTGSGGGAAQAPNAAAAASPAPAPAAEVFGPLSAEQEQAVTALEQQLDGASAEERPAHLRELVNLLIGFGRPDLAAQAQEDLARATSSTDDWTKAGDLYFEWLRLLEDRGENPQPVALRIIPAYEAALAERDDADVRTRLAWAYFYDPANPMKAIEQTKAVLEQDSTHVGATYNYAYFLMRINRIDQAITQMEKVKRFAGTDSVLVRHADAFITELKRASEAN